MDGRREGSCDFELEGVSEEGALHRQTYWAVFFSLSALGVILHEAHERTNAKCAKKGHFCSGHVFLVIFAPIPKGT